MSAKPWQYELPDCRHTERYVDGRLLTDKSEQMIQHSNSVQPAGTGWRKGHRVILEYQALLPMSAGRKVARRAKTGRSSRGRVYDVFDLSALADQGSAIMGNPSR